MVVPKESFGVGVDGGGGGWGGADEGEHFEAKEHGEEGETSVEVTAEERTVRVGVEHEEAAVRSGRKAGVVLVEGELVDGWWNLGLG